MNELTRERLRDLARMMREWAKSEARHPTPQGRLSVGERHVLEDAADACMALAHLDSRQGMVMVPREPTEQMIRGAIEANAVRKRRGFTTFLRSPEYWSAEQCYSAMIAAAPPQQDESR